jgi:hypothetical protein
MDNPAETRGICWVHKLQMLRGTRLTSPAGRQRADTEGSRFLVVVARHDADLFARVSEQLLDDPRVGVILDRRRGERRQDSRTYWRERRRAERRQAPDYWEDTRYHPVIVVSVRKGNELGGVAAPVEDASIPEVATMETDFFADVRRRIDDWARDGQDILNKMLPQLLEESESFRQRAEVAEGHSARLAREVEDLQHEVARLQGDLTRLRQERTEMAGTVERAFTDITRLAGDLLYRVKERV